MEGIVLTFPWGKVPPRRRMRGGTWSDLVLPHTRQGFALPPSRKERVKNIPRRLFGASGGIAKLGYLDCQAARSWPRRYFLAGVFMRMTPTTRMITMSGSI